VPDGKIELRGVRVHNLKHVDLDIPHQQLVVFCGVSGSGKTSLALDTLYAEGQRRYIESYSPYTRQFLERLDKPQADRIDGIPAAIAVTRDDVSRSGRATVGTATETIDYLRLLYSKIARLFCPSCGRLIERMTPEAAASRLAEQPSAARLMVGFEALAAEKESHEQLVRRLSERGFIRAVANGQIVRLDEGSLTPPAADRGLLVIVDRLSAGQSAQRLRDSLETAFTEGGGRAVVWTEAEHSMPGAFTIDDQPWQRLDYSSRLECAACRRQFADLEPRRLSFNSPLGACQACEGIGYVVEPGSDKSGRDGTICSTCEGTRLNEEARAWRVDRRNMAEVARLTIDDALLFIQNLVLSGYEQQLARTVLPQLQSRLGFLKQVGVGYLSLDRTVKTLSTGEAQRVSLTTALGSSLVNMLYVLDEPSVGLHPRDVHRLIAAIRDLKDRGNSVVVVEHEDVMLRAADQIIELGPGAGDRGGEVVFQGPLEKMLQPQVSLTGEYLAGRRGVSIPERRRPTNRGWIKLFGARGNNLQNITAEFPLNVLCLVTGVSGAGKSTLVQDTLYGALCRRKQKEGPSAALTLPFDDVVGCGQIDDVIFVDQSPIGRSPRSNPATYIKAFDPIRTVFAETIEARTHNYTAGHFSFNVEGGRCDACQGEGYLKVDMQFMPDVYMRCGQCRGQRYRKEILAVKYRGKGIAEVLEMTVREAFGFFRGQPKVQARLNQLINVGLDYLQLGQPANTLSAGEAQRLKLAAHLSEASRSRTLFILDEPTTGLHFADIVTLLDCFEALLSVGHSLIVVEHNLQLMRAADYIIDLGPEAGDGGGRIVASGTPEEIARCEASHTGRALRESLVIGH
jgi:excinuclease ABC subunit A